MTLKEAVATATRRLKASPDLQATADRDAVLLLLHALSIARTTLIAYPERELTAEQLGRYEACITRRLSSEPIQYITGQQEFYGLVFHVSSAVLIPRPETEHLVEAVLERVSKDLRLRILDVGTGSGAIAVALAVNLPQAQLTAIDISPPALAVARENAQSHGVEARIRFIQSDLLSPVTVETFDVIVSNPPYIPLGDRETLHPQVREHEPALALFAGSSGMAVYERLIPQARLALRPDGLLALEIGYGQRAAITALLNGWKNVSFVEDLQGIARVALATRRA